MNDAGIIDLYWQRSERAIPETENAYGPYCHTVAYNLLRNAEDAEESVNDTWLAAWNAMPPERPNSLKAFLGRITRNISVTRLRRSGSQKRGGGEASLAIDELSECLPGGATRRGRRKTASFSGALMRSSHCFPNGSGSFSSDGTSTR